MTNYRIIARMWRRFFEEIDTSYVCISECIESLIIPTLPFNPTKRTSVFSSCAKRHKYVNRRKTRFFARESKYSRLRENIRKPNTRLLLVFIVILSRGRSLESEARIRFLRRGGEIWGEGGVGRTSSWEINGTLDRSVWNARELVDEIEREKETKRER